MREGNEMAEDAVRLDCCHVNKGSAATSGNFGTSAGRRTTIARYSDRMPVCLYCVHILDLDRADAVDVAHIYLVLTK